MSFVSRGFGGRRRQPDELRDRLPPGQYAESGFPVLTAGPTPAIDPDDWGFRIDGMVGREREWTAAEFRELPFETVPCDIHCVTKWSKLGTSFGGVSLDVLLGEAEPHADYAIYSVRSAADVVYADELGDDVVLTFTREPPSGWSGHSGRIDAALIGAALPASATTFICGSNGFVEAASRLVLDAGADPARILTERFGPSG